MKTFKRISDGTLWAYTPKSKWHSFTLISDKKYPIIRLILVDLTGMQEV